MSRSLKWAEYQCLRPGALGELSQLRGRASSAESLGVQLPRQPHPPRGEPPALASALGPPQQHRFLGGPWGRVMGYLQFGDVPRWLPPPPHARTRTHRYAQPSRAEDVLGVPGVCCSQPRVESGWGDSLAAAADFISLFMAKQRTGQRRGMCTCRVAWPSQNSVTQGGV